MFHIQETEKYAYVMRVRDQNDRKINDLDSTNGAYATPTLSFDILKSEPEAFFDSLKEAEDFAIKKIKKKCEHVKIPKKYTEKQKMIQVERCCNAIARKTARGRGVFNADQNIVFYKGSSNLDSGIVITKISKSRWGVALCDNWDLYYIVIK